MVTRPVRGPVKVTGDTDSHAEYGVGAATDYGVGVGTFIYAPIAGVVTRYWSGSGGNSIRIDDGAHTKFFGQHLSAYRGSSQRAGVMDIVAESGNSGTPPKGMGNTYDPHFHGWFEVDGVRMSIEEYVEYAGGIPVARGDYTPSGMTTASSGTTFEEDEDMAFTDKHAFMVEQLFAATLGLDPSDPAAAKPITVDPRYNLGQSIRQSVWVLRQAVQALLDRKPVAGGGVALTAADLAAIDALDDDERALQTAAILAAIASGNTAILTAIANVDEATLATFGLRRL